MKLKAREIKKLLEKEHQGRINAYEDAVKENEVKLLTFKAQIEETEYLLEMFFDVTETYNVETKKVEYTEKDVPF